jgi:hypothetical protein
LSSQPEFGYIARATSAMKSEELKTNETSSSYEPECSEEDPNSRRAVYKTGAVSLAVGLAADFGGLEASGADSGSPQLGHRPGKIQGCCRMPH